MKHAEFLTDLVKTFCDYVTKNNMNSVILNLKYEEENFEIGFDFDGYETLRKTSEKIVEERK